jgi:hypothetical protein
MLICKDQATQTANHGGPIATETALGFTVIGLPAAIELDRTIQRQVFTQCMKAKGYEVTPPQ